MASAATTRAPAARPAVAIRTRQMQPFRHAAITPIRYALSGLPQFAQLRSSFTVCSAMPMPDSQEEQTENWGQESKQMSLNIGVIGAGQMSQALIKGWLSCGVSSPSRIRTTNRSPSGRNACAALGVAQAFDHTYPNAVAHVADHSDILLLGVKPQQMGSVLSTLAPHIDPQRHLVLSIAAGIRLATYEAALPEGTRVVRAMPNTPMLVGQGASAYCLGKHATPEDGTIVSDLLSAAGIALHVTDERMMDGVTGLSGSGPAYVYMLIEALADGGVLAGLPRNAALQLAAQTVAGAAAMVQRGGVDGGMAHPGVLKDAVTSPGGTTIAGLLALEQAGVRGAVMQAVQAASKRSEELSQQ